MEILINSRNMHISPKLESYVEKKVQKLQRYLPGITEVRVDLASENRRGKNQPIAQITVRHQRGALLRAEDKKQQDIYAAVDVALDRMYRQIERYKGKRKRRGGEQITDFMGVEAAPLLEPLEDEDEKVEIVRRKHITLVPIDEQEAIDRMEDLDHNFYVFLNANSGTVDVLYLREDGNYGILEAEAE